MTTAPRADIVLVDDHPEHLDYLTTLLRRAGYGGAAFNRAAPALCHLKRYPPRLVITDVFTPEKDGFEILQAVRHSFPDLPPSRSRSTAARSSPPLRRTWVGLPPRRDEQRP